MKRQIEELQGQLSHMRVNYELMLKELASKAQNAQLPPPLPEKESETSGLLNSQQATLKGDGETSNPADLATDAYPKRSRLAEQMRLLHALQQKQASYTAQQKEPASQVQAPGVQLATAEKESETSGSVIEVDSDEYEKLDMDLEVSGLAQLIVTDA